MSVEVEEARSEKGVVGENVLNWLQRFGLRCLILFFVLFVFFEGYPLGTLGYDNPWMTWLSNATSAVPPLIVPWIGQRIFGHPVAIGAGDTLFDYLNVSIMVVLAFFCALVWMLLDTDRRREGIAHEASRVFVRYVLAFIMFGYGFPKLFDVQFPQPSPIDLIHPLGDFKPPELMWAFMGYSQLYSTLAGVAEVVGGLLLFSRRTTTLGALIVAGVMTNVALMNVAYFDPIRVAGTTYLIMALFLLLPDARRLIRAILGNQGFPKTPVTHRAPRGWLSPASIAVKAIIIAILLYFPIMFSFTMAVASKAVQKMPMSGIYQVEDFRSSAQQGARWERVGIEDLAGTGNGPDANAKMAYVLGVRTTDDTMQYYGMELERIDATHGNFNLLQCASQGCLALGVGSSKPSPDIVLRYVVDKSVSQTGSGVPQPTELTVRGAVNSSRISMHLKRVNPSTYLLVRTPFHLIEPDNMH